MSTEENDRKRAESLLVADILDDVRAYAQDTIGVFKRDKPGIGQALRAFADRIDAAHERAGILPPVGIMQRADVVTFGAASEGVKLDIGPVLKLFDLLERFRDAVLRVGGGTTPLASSDFVWAEVSEAISNPAGWFARNTESGTTSDDGSISKLMRTAESERDEGEDSNDSATEFKRKAPAPQSIGFYEAQERIALADAIAAIIVAEYFGAIREDAQTDYFVKIQRIVYDAITAFIDTVEAQKANAKSGVNAV